MSANEDDVSNGMHDVEVPDPARESRGRVSELSPKEAAYLDRLKKDSADIVHGLQVLESRCASRMGVIVIDDTSDERVKEVVQVLGGSVLPGRPAFFSEAVIIHILEGLNSHEGDDIARLSQDVKTLSMENSVSRSIVVFADGNCVVSYINMREDLH